MPVRTFTDWGNTPLGYFEVDLVEHCRGTKKSGNFVYSLVLANIASGGKECIALAARNGSYVIKGVMLTRKQLPFLMHRIDNDNAFTNYVLFA